MVVMLDTPCSEVVWRVLATHSVRQFPLHFLCRASPCTITFQLDSTTPIRNIINLHYKAYFTSAFTYRTALSEMQLDPSYTRNKRFCLFNLSPADHGQSADEFMSTCSAVMLKVLLCILYSSFKNNDIQKAKLLLSSYVLWLNDFSWFQTFVFWMLSVFFWVIPRRLNNSDTGELHRRKHTSNYFYWTSE